MGDIIRIISQIREKIKELEEVEKTLDNNLLEIGSEACEIDSEARQLNSEIQELSGLKREHVNAPHFFQHEKIDAIFGCFVLVLLLFLACLIIYYALGVFPLDCSINELFAIMFSEPFTVLLGAAPIFCATRYFVRTNRKRKKLKGIDLEDLSTKIENKKDKNNELEQKAILNQRKHNETCTQLENTKSELQQWKKYLDTIESNDSISQMILRLIEVLERELGDSSVGIIETVMSDPFMRLLQKEEN